MSQSRADTYYRFVGILAFLGIVLALASIVVVIYVAPLAYSVFKLSVIGGLNVVITVLALNRQLAALVLAFLLNLYDLFYLHHVGVIYDAFHMNASILSYCNFILALVTLVVSGLGLLLYFKQHKD